jgi:hypothetical protein
MHFDPSEIEFLWKDRSSGTGGCPALYKVPGGYIAQGKLLDPATRAQLRDLAADEGGLFIPDNVIDRLRG